MQHIQCNITDSSQASAFVYNGTAFSYDGIPFTNPGLSQPLYIGGTGTSATVKPAGEVKLAVAALMLPVIAAVVALQHGAGSTKAGSVRDACMCRLLAARWATLATSFECALGSTCMCGCLWSGDAHALLCSHSLD